MAGVYRALRETFAVAATPRLDGRHNVIGRVQSGGCVAYATIAPEGVPELLVLSPSPMEGGLERRAAVLALRPYVLVEFSADGRAMTQAAVGLRCSQEVAPTAFLAFASDLVTTLGNIDRWGWKDCCAAWASWEGAFRAIPQPSLEQQMGLWGELRLLAAFSETPKLVDAWHGPSADPWDFFFGGVGIEVKTSLRPRSHIFSWTQLPDDSLLASVFVASFHVARDSRGPSTHDLVVALADRMIDPSLFLKRAAEAGWREDVGVVGETFELVAPPIFVPLSRIPRVHSVDDGVTDLHFRVRLDPGDVVTVDERKTLVAAFGSYRPEDLAFEGATT